MIKELELKGAELLLYAYVASNLNDAGVFQKNYYVIEVDTGLTIRTIQRAFNALSQKKLITIQPLKDGCLNINRITINQRQLDLIQDKDFNDVLEAYTKYIGVKEDPNSKNYQAYKSVAKLESFHKDNFIDAIKCYGDTILDGNYYKTHLYPFDSFATRYTRYLPSGYEYQQYEIFYNTNKRPENRAYYAGIIYELQHPSHLLEFDDLELGHVEM